MNSRELLFHNNTARCKNSSHARADASRQESVPRFPPPDFPSHVLAKLSYKLSVNPETHGRRADFEKQLNYIQYDNNKQINKRKHKLHTSCADAPKSPDGSQM